MNVLTLVLFFVSFIFISFGQFSGLHNEISKEDLFSDLSKLVSDILIKIKVKHCYAIITDEIYANVLTDRLFVKMDKSPVYIVSVLTFYMSNFLTDVKITGTNKNF